MGPMSDRQTPSRLGLVARRVRTQQWWNHKVPPLLLVAYLLLLGSGGPPVTPAGHALFLLAGLVAAIVGVASAGHIMNDWADLGADAKAGKANVLSQVSRPVRATLLLGAVFLGAGAWMVIDPGVGGWVVFALELGLLTAYSAPPFRLKGRGLLGVAADATYASALPIALTALAMATVIPADQRRSDIWLVAVAFVWALLVGVRGILLHQIGDRDADTRSGVLTAVVRHGPRSMALLLDRVVFPLEVVALVGLLAAMTLRIPATLALVAAALAWRFVAQECPVGSDRTHREPEDVGTRSWSGRIGQRYLNDLYEQWMPLFPLGLLVIRSPAYGIVALVHMVAFDNGIVRLMTDDRRHLPNLRMTVAYWRRYHELRRTAADHLPAMMGTAREEQPSAGPARRWVFIVCGPASHVRTLERSRRALERFTKHDIVVVTDSSRNEEPIRGPGVIDVKTPSHLTHHQASIYLKTSVERWVDLDEAVYCYLDSDVYAVHPDVDSVFDHAQGPVTFASDLPVFDNNIDRFSPWAMRCDCLGVGDTRTCDHLRTALADRFGVTVPPTWVPWNGGVFLFGARSKAFLATWHETTMRVFDDPRFAIRDQGTLIVAAWQFGIQHQQRLPQRFNFIVDLDNTELTYFGQGLFGLCRDGCRIDARFLHLYTSALDDPDWDFDRDVRDVILRKTALESVRDVDSYLSHIRQMANANWRSFERWRYLQQEHYLYPPMNLAKRTGRSVRRRLGALRSLGRG